MLNSLHELTFSTTADSVEAGYIREDYYAVVKVEGQYREFIIDSIVESDDSELIKEVKASLSSIELSDTLLENKVTGSDPRLLLTSILSATRWSVGTVETGIYNRNFTEDVQFMSALEAVHALADFYNCDIHFSYLIDGNKVIKRSVNLFVRLGADDGKRFEIDKDITSIEREIDTTALKTAIYPVMKTEDDDGKTVLTTIANVAWSKAAGDPVDKPLGQKYVGDPVALQNWGRLDKNGNLRHRMKLYEFTEEVSVAQMLSMSWVNLAKYTSPKITYTVNVLDLYSLLGEDYLHEKVVIGDTVTIIDRYFAVPIEISDRVIEIERDLLDPSNTVVTVGTENKSYNSDRGGRDQVLNDRIDAVNKNAVSALESANGKNTNYYGSLEPTMPNTGDTWFRPHPDNPEEQQMLVWDGVQWIVELDTSKISEIQDAIAVIDSDLGENIKTANEAVNKAQQAIESAGFANSAITAANGQIASLEQNLNGFQQVVQDTYANKATVTALATQWTQTTELANGHTSAINSLGDQLNLRVAKSELISQINISPESILIASNKIQIKGDTYIENGTIKTAHIADLAVSGAKIANASISSAKIISLDASKITANTLSAITANTGNLNVSGNLTMTTDNNVVKGVYTYGEAENTAYIPRYFSGDFELGRRYLAFTGDVYSATSGGGQGAFNHYSETYFGLDYFKMRTFNNRATNRVLQSRIDMRNGRIEISDTWGQSNLGEKTTLAYNYINAKEVYAHDALNTNRIVPHRGFSTFQINPDRLNGIPGLMLSNAADGFAILPPDSRYAGFNVGTDGTPRVWSWAINNRTYSAPANVHVTGEGTLGRAVSARKYKTDIAKEKLGNAKGILNLQPSSWLDKVEVSKGKIKQRYYGFIADDFHDLGLTEVVQYGADGQVEGLAYDRISMYHNVILQDHEQQLASVTQQLTTVANSRLQHSLLLESRLLYLQQTVVQLQQEMEQLRTA